MEMDLRYWKFGMVKRGTMDCGSLETVMNAKREEVLRKEMKNRRERKVRRQRRCAKILAEQWRFASVRF